MSYNDWKDGRLAGIEFAAKYFEGFIKSSLEPKQVATMLRAIIIIEEKLGPSRESKSWQSIPHPGNPIRVEVSHCPTDTSEHGPACS